VLLLVLFWFRFRLRFWFFSFSRVSIEYTTLPSEAARILPHRPPLNWPSKGAIVFQNLSLRYREGLPLILENVNIEINANEKIGVVGMTPS
jgi:ABC-type multidrug transport system fused ATPase/permease subunit